ncbi:MAG: DUF1365 domain-containing protein [Melioribacteraceae bacterium]|nr:DUF1365 domain-containing protein [Melioribacteraceae bacterium]
MFKKSHIYECKVMHNRLKPKKHSFNYKFFMFYLDLDEIESITKKLKLVNNNKFGVYSFRKKDHLNSEDKNLKQTIIDYAKKNGVETEISKIFLLTNLAFLGYNFNPVSFYYCFDKDSNPVCVIPEVGNTFNEQKFFFLGNHTFNKKSFKARIQKFFYVSPFIKSDTHFDFNLAVPNEKLNIKIDDYENGERFFLSTLKGEQKKLTDFNLIKYSLRFPFITFKIIWGIHWHAMKLYLKNIPWFRKNDFQEIQKDMVIK